MLFCARPRLSPPDCAPLIPESQNAFSCTTRTYGGYHQLRLCANLCWKFWKISGMSLFTFTSHQKCTNRSFTLLSHVTQHRKHRVAHQAHKIQPNQTVNAQSKNQMPSTVRLQAAKLCRGLLENRKSSSSIASVGFVLWLGTQAMRLHLKTKTHELFS